LKRFLGSAVVVLAVTFPFAAFADVSGNNVALSSGTTLNLDTGQTVTSGGDLTWTGTAFNVAGSATDGDLASTQYGALFNGQSGYMNLVAEGQSLISEFSSQFGPYLSSAAITPKANDILVVKTNGGNYTAVLVVSVGSSVTIDFHTFGGSSGGGGTPGGPDITAVVNNYSYTPVGFPNSGIAPGSIMLIFGSGMSQSVANVALNSTVAPGIPTTWEGER